MLLATLSAPCLTNRTPTSPNQDLGRAAGRQAPDSARLDRKDKQSSHGLTEDHKTVAPHFE